MPSLAIQYNPNVGPLIQVAVWPPNFTPPNPGSPTAPVNLQFYLGLADTGASCTCVSAKVISDLKLQPSGKQLVGGVHGSNAVNSYQFQVVLAFPQSVTPGGLTQAHLVPMPVNGVEFVPPGGFDLLIGRDILCRGAFTMSFDGHAILSI